MRPPAVELEPHQLIVEQGDVAHRARTADGGARAAEAAGETRLPRTDRPRTKPRPAGDAEGAGAGVARDAGAIQPP